MAPSRRFLLLPLLRKQGSAEKYGAEAGHLKERTIGHA